MFNSQIGQDKFILNILKEKRNGFFLELGSFEPIHINNTYILEKEYNWRGIMVEYDELFLPQYKKHRPNSIHVINDATQIDYKTLFETNNIPLELDYLQVDLHVCIGGNMGNTLAALEKLNNDIFDKYKFATVTFEHDIYGRYDTNKDYFDITRDRSREIFKNRGYVCAFEDVGDAVNPFEDWYVHPDLVDMDHVKKIQELNYNNYKLHRNLNINSINYNDIVYA
jgi:hypothetical protein